MLHNIEPYSYRFDCSSLYKNLTITAEFLEQKILKLQQLGYNFVSMDKFLLDKQDDKEHKNIVITIDDGWKGVYSYAFPIFKKYSIPFVFYIATDLIDNGFKNCKLPELDGMNILCDYVYKISDNKQERNNIFLKLWNKFKYKKRLLFWQDNYKILQNIYGKEFKINFDEYKQKSICSIEELREMVESGLCELGSHSHNHTHISRISKNKMIKQFIISKNKVENISNRECKYFSYPYGHYNLDSDKIVRNYFKSATIVKPTNLNPRKDYLIRKNDDIYRLPRILVDMSDDVDKIIQDNQDNYI